MCLYDLQKAFDAVEYLVLLECYDVSVNSKLWRLLKSWYEGGSCQVKVDGMQSERLVVERGISAGLVQLLDLYLPYSAKFWRDKIFTDWSC